MYKVTYGGRTGSPYALDLAPDLVVVRTRSRQLISGGLNGGALSRRGRDLVQALQSVARFEAAGVEVLRYPSATRTTRARTAARSTLKREPDVHFAGHVLVDPASKTPVIYTENFFIKFADQAAESRCRALLKSYKLEIKRPLEYAANAYFVAAPDGIGRKLFDLAARLLKDDLVALCHPELVRKSRHRTAFPPQWHLQRTTVNGNVIDAHANVVAAWVLADGQGTTIAIIDDGVDLDHEEFTRAGKIIAPRDVTRSSDDPRPGNRDNHGTSCAGVACADGRHGASGVAPNARLLPIRLASDLGSQAEADAFVWAAQHGADVISCSWGPVDGDWSDPHDPLHQQQAPLPDATRLAIEWTIANGRAGKGCVIVWAAGNGNESVDLDGYASYPKVIAVAACNDRGTRSAYSDKGVAVWCAFPSNDVVASRTPGIWTTDRSGAQGYNPGRDTLGDALGNYTNGFGGTSSAAPGVAGVAALVLTRNPNLRWNEVKDIIKQGCDRIDAAGGQYDAQGHSRFYGYGRVNARRVLELAAGGTTVPPAPPPAQPPAPPVSKPLYRARHQALFDVAIADLATARLALEVGDAKPLRAISVSIDVLHTYVGDLVIRLLPPSGAPVTLHDRVGGGTDNLNRSYDPATTPALAALVGQSPKGTWTLEIADRAAQDTGTLRSWGLELGFDA